MTRNYFGEVSIGCARFVFLDVVADLMILAPAVDLLIMVDAG
jgi:hypothetical protein